MSQSNTTALISDDCSLSDIRSYLADIDIRFEVLAAPFSPFRLIYIYADYDDRDMASIFLRFGNAIKGIYKDGKIKWLQS